MYLLFGIIIMILAIMIVGLVPALIIASGGALLYSQWSTNGTTRGSPYFKKGEQA